MDKSAEVAWRWPHWLGLGVLLLATAPFAVYAAIFGARGLLLDLSAESRLFDGGAAFSNGAMALHMAGGALITLLALTQPVGPLRRAWPRLHRVCGYVFLVAATVSALGGLIFIGLRGTIGGPLMDAAFAGYGVCVLIATVQTVRAARRGDFASHADWALRAILLGLGSWIYRAHYTLWYVATGGVGSEPDFSGWFDQIQVFAFYAPYLLAAEIVIQARRRRAETRSM